MRQKAAEADVNVCAEPAAEHVVDVEVHERDLAVVEELPRDVRQLCEDVFAVVCEKKSVEGVLGVPRLERAANLAVVPESIFQRGTLSLLPLFDRQCLPLVSRLLSVQTSRRVVHSSNALQSWALARHCAKVEC